MKILQKLILPCLLMCSTALWGTTKEDFENFANEWITTYVESSHGQLFVSPEEMNILLNLTYFSYKRSASTIASQDYVLQALNTNWHLLQNVVQTRLNPAHSTPYKIEQKKYEKMMKQAWDGQQEHEYIDSTYAQMIESILDEDHNTSKLLRDSIKIMRDQARAALIDSLSAIKEYIEALIEECQKKRITNSSDTVEMTKGIFDYLLELIPPLAAHSFAAVDNMGIEASEEGYKVLAEIERIHNLIWMVLEQRRANFYAIMYRSLYAVARKSKLEKSVFLVSFDNEGPIAADAQHSLLPDPRKIMIFE